MLLIPGVGSFSNKKNLVLDQHIAETKTNLKNFILSSIKVSLILDYQTLKYKAIFVWIWDGTQSGVFGYIKNLKLVWCAWYWERSQFISVQNRLTFQLKLWKSMFLEFDLDVESILEGKSISKSISKTPKID